MSETMRVSTNTVGNKDEYFSLSCRFALIAIPIKRGIALISHLFAMESAFGATSTWVQKAPGWFSSVFPMDYP